MCCPLKLLAALFSGSSELVTDIRTVCDKTRIYERCLPAECEHVGISTKGLTVP